MINDGLCKMDTLILSKYAKRLRFYKHIFAKLFIAGIDIINVLVI